MSRKRTTIEKVEGGFILTENGEDPYADPVVRVAKDEGELKKMLGLQGETLLPSIPLVDKDGNHG